MAKKKKAKKVTKKKTAKKKTAKKKVKAKAKKAAPKKAKAKAAAIPHAGVRQTKGLNRPLTPTKPTNPYDADDPREGAAEDEIETVSHEEASAMEPADDDERDEDFYTGKLKESGTLLDRPEDYEEDDEEEEEETYHSRGAARSSGKTASPGNDDEDDETSF